MRPRITGQQTTALIMPFSGPYPPALLWSSRHISSTGRSLGNFNKDFVHTGIFPKDIARKISRAQEVRHESDYSVFYMVSISETKEQIDTAAEVVQMVEEYLNTQTTPYNS